MILVNFGGMPSSYQAKLASFLSEAGPCKVIIESAHSAAGRILCPLVPLIGNTFGL
jgi:hypothetical protein